MMAATESQKKHRSIDKETYLNPPAPTGVDLTNVPLVEATDESLKEVGCIVENPDDFTVESGRFEIVPWPRRQTDTCWPSDRFQVTVRVPMRPASSSTSGTRTITPTAVSCSSLPTVRS